MGTRFFILVFVATLLLGSMGSGCFVAFFSFQCLSDVDCLPDEFCDAGGFCVSIFFLNEEMRCQETQPCDAETNSEADAAGAAQAP